MEITRTPYNCSNCGVLVTDHELSDETLSLPAHFVCDDCVVYDEDDEDDDHEYEPDYDSIMEDRAERNLWAAERALERAIDRARGYD